MSQALVGGVANYVVVSEARGTGFRALPLARGLL
jgi:hypothetical protein